jgi:hypothetical protein
LAALAVNVDRVLKRAVAVLGHHGRGVFFDPDSCLFGSDAVNDFIDSSLLCAIKLRGAQTSKPQSLPPDPYEFRAPRRATTNGNANPDLPR